MSASATTTPGVEAVEARPLVVLDLEQLEQPDLLGRGADHPEMADRVGQQDPGRGDFQQLDAARRQHGEHFDHVEVVDEGVDDLDESIAVRACRFIALCSASSDTVHPSPGCSRLSSVETQSTGDNVAATTPTGRPGKCVGPDPHQCLGDRNLSWIDTIPDA